MFLTCTISSRRKEQRFYGDYIFSEPNQKAREGFNWIFNESVYGPWKNWRTSLERLISIGKSDYYGVFQDDIVLCKNWRPYLLSIKLPPVFSLFTIEKYLAKEKWGAVYEGRNLWMAQALFFRVDIAKALLADNSVNEYYGNINIDNRIGAFLEKIGQPMYFHNPSLCQHIGHQSTIWKNGVKAEGDRAASNFPGEDFDCLSLI